MLLGISLGEVSLNSGTIKKKNHGKTILVHVVLKIIRDEHARWVESVGVASQMSSNGPLYMWGHY